MNAKQINVVTNVVGVGIAVLEPLNSYIHTQPFNWVTFATCILGAVVAYFTGKSTIAAGKQ